MCCEKRNRIETSCCFSLWKLFGFQVAFKHRQTFSEIMKSESRLRKSILFVHMKIFIMNGSTDKLWIKYNGILWIVYNIHLAAQIYCYLFTVNFERIFLKTKIMVVDHRSKWLALFVCVWITVNSLYFYVLRAALDGYKSESWRPASLTRFQEWRRCPKAPRITRAALLVRFQGRILHISRSLQCTL
jgi:hypothetical protein